MSGIKGGTWLKVLGFRLAGGKCNLVIRIGERNVVAQMVRAQRTGQPGEWG